MTRYDYIIAGGGCAGRSLAVRLLPYLEAKGKKLLIVDREFKHSNDRTWCFWEEKQGLFESIVYKRWSNLKVASADRQLQFSIAPYQYKMIRGIDFYQFTDQLLEHAPQVDFLKAVVAEMGQDKNSAYVIIDGDKYLADYIFNSISPVVKNDPFPFIKMLQHFKGWVIETGEPVFDPGQAVFMDFDAPQTQGTGFYYVLPFTETSALIEYTVFSPAMLEDKEYDTALSGFVRTHLHATAYKILEVEKGSIPMTDYPFNRNNDRIIHTGTAGGQTKASSGYTFNFIQKDCEAILNALIEDVPIGTYRGTPGRFHTYDGILLDVLQNSSSKGKDIFMRLFERNDPRKVLKFLDNETNIWEECSIFLTLQLLDFTRSYIRRSYRIAMAGT
ncbi:lycopene cyclase [Chitinophaga caeni]|uniref:Lycopene cyclase n=1 Tax=Chitinophaga caeni TaxID=2029983 RepID=A0A291QV34_9BACT|nr:lycopene cyclase family protein [Chitinophaga caeni]ATL47781.1 lycopene cyclase [Chitinophaga caeni]